MIREILIWPEALLARKCEPVTEITPDIRRLLEDMAETMVAAKGAGLAAPQVGFALRLVTLLVVNPKGGSPGILKLVNPVIVERGQARQIMREGCLSVPGYFENVRRHTFVRVEASDETGAKVEIAGDGQLAQALQHELEHLDGKMFVDHISPLKRDQQRRRFEKAKAKGMRYAATRPEPQDFTQQTPTA